MNPQLETRSAKPRDPYLDNGKVILIALVVVGHLLAAVAASRFGDTAYKWIYTFHMPAFVVITGYLSRSYRGEPRQVRALVTGVLVPYLVFQVIVRAEPWLFFGEPLHLNFFTPAWSNWFLLALFAWRLLVPVLNAIRYPLTCSLVLALLSVLYGGISQGLSGARILSYLPFFVLGLTVTPERLEAFKRFARRLWARAAAAAFVAAVAILLYVADDRVPSGWLMISGLASGDYSNLQQLLIRVAVMMLATAMLLAILVLVPQRRMFFSSLGSVTLTIYLLQEATLLIPRHFLAMVPAWSAPMVMLLMLGGALYALLLGSRPVQRATRWLVDPIGTFAVLRRLAFVERMPERSDVAR